MSFNPRGWDAKYPISSLRVPLGNDTYSHPEIPSAFHDFKQDFQVDDRYNVTYSYGPEWHIGITDDETGKLPNCYYMVNTDGRHWYEFETNPDVITLGCSITAGMGLPIEFLWPAMYQEFTGQTVNNIGKPGASLTRMVYRCFHHISHYGQPKKIFIALGDHMRYWLQTPPPCKGCHAEDKVVFWDAGMRSYTGPYGQPFVYEDSVGNDILLSPDLIVGENLRALEMLAYYCDAYNIELAVHPFSQVTQQEFRRMGWKVLSRPHRQSPLQALNDPQELFWDWGFDFHENTKHHAHPGLEAHLDILSAFLGHYPSEKQLSTVRTWCEHLLDYDAPRFNNAP